MGGPAGTPARPRLTRDERRQHFLDSAARIITERGAESVTMEGVAAEAGVSKALGYRYFANRDDLLLALFDREVRELDERTIAAVMSTDRFEGRLRAVVEVWQDLIVERGNLMGSIQRSKLIEGPIEQRRLSRQDQIDEFFAAIILDDYRMSKDDALFAAGAMLAAADGALRLWHGKAWSREEVRDRYLRFSIGAIEALASGPRERGSGAAGHRHELADGRSVLLRPIRPSDDAAYREFGYGLSPTAIYYRFFSPRHALSEEEISHFLHVDGANRYALVAETPEGAIVGVGRYDRLKDDGGGDRDAAEVAFIVSESHEHQGIATTMLRLLAEEARRHGITELVASVLPDNHKMMSVFNESPLLRDRQIADGVIEVALDVPAADADQSSEDAAGNA